jgi:hypothetical protein
MYIPSLETLKTLPLHVLCMIKHPFMLENGGIRNPALRLVVDCFERSYEIHRMLSLPVRETMKSLYPRYVSCYYLA